MDNKDFSISKTAQELIPCLYKLIGKNLNINIPENEYRDLIDVNVSYDQLTKCCFYLADENRKFVYVLSEDTSYSIRLRASSLLVDLVEHPPK